MSCGSFPAHLSTGALWLVYERHWTPSVVPESSIHRDTVVWWPGPTGLSGDAESLADGPAWSSDSSQPRSPAHCPFDPEYQRRGLLIKYRVQTCFKVVEAFKNWISSDVWDNSLSPIYRNGLLWWSCPPGWRGFLLLPHPDMFYPAVYIIYKCISINETVMERLHYLRALNQIFSPIWFVLTKNGILMLWALGSTPKFRFSNCLEPKNFVP